MKKIISTTNAPAAIGPYSQGVVAGGLLFLSGSIPIEPMTGAIVAGGIEEQTRRVLDNIRALLAAAGSGFEKVVKTTVFLSDMNDFVKMNEIYAQYFVEGAYPARSTIQVARLPKDAKIEIELIAQV